jgi:phage baseplate assembly protein V
VVEYDRAAHAYAISIPAGGKATVKAGASSTFEVTSDAIRLTVGGTQLVLSASGIQITSATGLNINGAVTQTGGPLTSNGIALSTHTHSGVTSGISNTAGPNP